MKFLDVASSVIDLSVMRAPNGAHKRGLPRVLTIAIHRNRPEALGISFSFLLLAGTVIRRSARSDIGDKAESPGSETFGRVDAEGALRGGAARVNIRVLNLYRASPYWDITAGDSPFTTKVALTRCCDHCSLTST